MSYFNIRKEPYASLVLLALGTIVFFYRFLPMFGLPVIELNRLTWLVFSQLLLSTGGLSGAYYIYCNRHQIQNEAKHIDSKDKNMLLFGSLFVLAFLLYLTYNFAMISLLLPIGGALSFIIALLLN